MSSPRIISRIAASKQLSSSLHTFFRQIPRQSQSLLKNSSPTTTNLIRSNKHHNLISSSNFTTTRTFSTDQIHHKETPNSSEPDQPSGLSEPRTYNFSEISQLSNKPTPNRILIDVREPSELLSTGRIPSAISIPLSSSPDAFFLSPEEFEDRFGFARPDETTEVIFYCKAGVRSRQAALLAAQARPSFGGRQGKYDGSWLDWEKNGGKVEKEGEQQGGGEGVSRGDMSAVGDQAKGRP